MSFKQKQKLTICTMFLLVILVFILIGSLLDVMDQNTELLDKNRELQNVLSLSKHEVVKLKSVLKNAWLADADISEGIKLLDKK